MVEIKIERKEVYKMPKYEKLSPEITERIAYDRKTGNRPDFAAKSALAQYGCRQGIYLAPRLSS